MKTIYLELSATYREIEKVLDNFGLSYTTNPERFDYYVEQLVRAVVAQRWFNCELLRMQDYLKRHFAYYPVSKDYFLNQAVQTYVVYSPDVWHTVSEALTFTPRASFMMWHVERGLWKMVASGVDPYVQQFLFSHS